MTIPRRRKLGLALKVFHPDSMIDLAASLRTDWEANADDDGHYVKFDMTSMGGDCLLEVRIQRGIAATSAASILRKLADLIERAGTELLAEPGGFDGNFNKNGEAMVSPLLVLDEDEIPRAI